MKKVTIVLALAVGLGFMSSQAVQAIEPTHFLTFMMNINANMVLEEEIEFQDWMLSAESFQKVIASETEQRIEVQAWMLDFDLEQNNTLVDSEPEIELKDWMLRTFEPENRTLALED